MDRIEKQRKKHMSKTILCVCVCVCVFRAAPEAHGGSQARGLIGAVAAGPMTEPQQHQI